MKKLILTVAVAGVFTLTILGCNSTKNMSGTSDSTSIDTTRTAPVDTAGMVDTVKTMPVDTSKMPPAQ